MSRTFEIVKKYIDEYDYYKLLYSGAPDDEFDDYSQMIAEEIDDDCSVEDIASIIAKAFNKGFGEGVEPEQFLVIAKNIKFEISNLT